MKNLLLLPALAMLVLSSCDLFKSPDKKITIEKSDVYYKDGATEAIAKALGDYLLEIDYFDKDSEKSAQVSKENGLHVVRLVVDQKNLSKVANATTAFWIMQPGISQQVFNNETIRLILSDAQMKDVQTIDPIAEYKPIKTATIFYNSDRYKKSDAEKLAAVFEEEGFFSFESEQTITMTKEENTNVVRIMVDNKLLTDHIDALLPAYQVLLYDLKTDAFSDQKTAMCLTASANFKDFKNIPVPTENDVARIMHQLNGTDTKTANVTTSIMNTESATAPRFVKDHTGGL